MKDGKLKGKGKEVEKIEKRKKGEYMEITATTKDGYLISATKNEVKDILRSVTGQDYEELAIGQKIPAFDYATTITKIKELKANYAFRQLLVYVNKFNEEIKDLEIMIDRASDIEI